MKSTFSLFALLWIAVVLMSGQPSFGEPVTLVNRDGDGIQAEILSATAASVEVRRLPDGKSFSLKISELSDESRKIVSEWRADQPPPLKKHVSLELPISRPGKNKPTVFEVSLPEGDYNYPVSPKYSYFEFVHKSGSLYVDVSAHDVSKKEVQVKMAEVRSDYESRIERDLLRLKPDDRKRLEPLSYIASERYGEFEGCFVSRPGHHGCLGGEWTLISQDYKIIIMASPHSKVVPQVDADSPVKYADIGPFRRKNIPAILASLKINKSK